MRDEISRWIAGLRVAIRSIIRRTRVEDELNEEFQYHLERQVDEELKAGLSPHEARHAALRAMGAMEQSKEECRDVRRANVVSDFSGDLRYAVRALRNAPGFTMGTVLVLALGIGANTTIFSVLNATLLQLLPFPDPERLATVWNGRIDDPKSLRIVSLPNYRDWKAQNHVFEEMALFDSAGRGYNLTGSGEPEQVLGLRVTASFFTVLGVRPLLGRTFEPAEEDPGRNHVVVLSHGLWVRRFAADSTLVGKTIEIDSAPHTVVGVMPPHFIFQFWSGPRQLWVPAGWTKADLERGSNSFIAIARLKSGVALADARSEMDVIGRALAAAYPDDNPGQTVRVVPMSQYSSQGLRAPLYTILGIVGFVLLIACVNVANLFLARASTRQREFAIRRALGASHGRLVRQLLTESVLLAGLSVGVGLLLAIWSVRVLPAFLTTYLGHIPLRPLNAINLDAWVLAFTASVSIATGVAAGLGPAIAAFRNDLNHPLKEHARESTSNKSRLRYGLVAVEVALTAIVLSAAGAMIMSVVRLLGVDPGLDPKNVLVMQMSLPQENLYYGPPGHPRFCDDLDQSVGSVSGIVAVSAIAHLPIGGGLAGRSIAIEGRPDPGPRRQPSAWYSVACPNILRVLDIPLIAGREFTPRDTLQAQGVVLVNESMASQFWPDEDAVGKRFKIGLFGSDAPWLTVVGVYGNVRQRLDTEPAPSFLRPYRQAAWPAMSIVTKTTTTPRTFVIPMKSALAVIEPNQPVSSIRTMEEVVGTSVSSRRFAMFLISGFALLALVLSVVGIAGVVGYSVAQRSSEIGVRMALGAQRSDVLRLVLGHSLCWTLIGMVLGVVASLGLLRLMSSLLFGVTPTDPAVLVSVSFLLLVVSLAASYVPARRAMHIDPVSVLRHD